MIYRLRFLVLYHGESNIFVAYVHDSASGYEDDSSCGQLFFKENWR
jgi:hypothetical protein